MMGAPTKLLNLDFDSGQYDLIITIIYTLFMINFTVDPTSNVVKFINISKILLTFSIDGLHY